MLVLQLLVLGLPLACTASGQGGTPSAQGGGDERLTVPEGLVDSEVGGDDGGLTLLAFTLVEGANGPALYAAVRNDENVPLCQAGMLTDFYDQAGVLVASVGSSLESGRLYRLDDGSNTLVNCVAPGQIAMTASPTLPDSVVIDELGHLEHQFPAFGVDGLVAVDALHVSDVKRVATHDGNAYTGALVNAFDATLSQPRVAIFPVNRSGRPLGVATSSGTAELAPGATWSFTTSSVDDRGVGYVAYPAASAPR